MREDRRVTDGRMDRLENKIDKLTDAVTELIKTEATIQAMGSRLNVHSEQIKKNDERLDAIEQRVPIYNLFIDGIKKTLWIVGGVILAGVLGSVITFNVV